MTKMVAVWKAEQKGMLWAYSLNSRVHSRHITSHRFVQEAYQQKHNSICLHGKSTLKRGHHVRLSLKRGEDVIQTTLLLNC